MQQFLTMTLLSGPSTQLQLQIVFQSDFQQYAVLDNVRAMAEGLFPGASILVEQADDLTFVVTRG